MAAGHELNFSVCIPQQMSVEQCLIYVCIAQHPWTIHLGFYTGIICAGSAVGLLRSKLSLPLKILEHVPVHSWRHPALLLKCPQYLIVPFLLNSKWISFLLIEKILDFVSHGKGLITCMMWVRIPIPASHI